MTDMPVFVEQNDSINRFIQLTYMTLHSTGPVPLQRLEQAYRDMHSIIHEQADDSALDSGAFSYVCARLPSCVFSTKLILFGQSESFLEERGVPVPKSAWTEVYAKARRRRYLFDGDTTLIAFLSSKSDLDDVIPSLLAFQIEWNKCHRLLANVALPKTEDALDEAKLAKALHIERSALSKVRLAIGPEFLTALKTMKTQSCDILVQNYEASYCRYRKETETWWKHIKETFPDIESRPVYFVSSNTHSLINILSGFTEYHRKEILSFASKRAELAPFAKQITSNAPLARSTRNILYYLLMKYEQASPEVRERRIAWENKIGIQRISSTKTLDVPTQIIDLQQVYNHTRTADTGSKLPEALATSNALILNIDYPLGRTAYFILNKIAEHVERILGIYVIGKAASLFATRGDVLIPSSITDQHTRNRYFFENSIRAEDLEPYLDTGTHGIYDNQRAITVLGTLLQNRQMLNDLLLAGITDLEMEAGPYLAAVYEITRAKRYPENEIITMNPRDMELGIIHYVSDNPLSAHRLDTSLETEGIEATYASTMAVLQKIISKEVRAYGKN